ncbi:alcohol dehydrogenase, putative [Ricinus communis]|uniref:Alcohol dehydrogenase, putative n=1 Tax=Ricinus communis TaxID=3988 RepID=B9SSH3_RICCO|nr:alcohol dehydrogenase, putative [Ricinus communis]
MEVQLGTLAEFTVAEERLEGFMNADFKKGQNIFVVGGAGGVGNLVVQLAKHFYGASYVVATTRTPKVEFFQTLTVSGENLEKLRPYLETDKLKAAIDPTGPYNIFCNSGGEIGGER